MFVDVAEGFSMSCPPSKACPDCEYLLKNPLKTRDGYKVDRKGDLVLANSATTRGKLLSFAQEVDDSWARLINSYVRCQRELGKYEVYAQRVQVSRFNCFETNGEYLTPYKCFLPNSDYMGLLITPL